MPQSPWVNIKKEDFVSLQTQLGWTGAGSEHDPYIVTSVAGMSLFIKFIKMSDHIIIKDLTISRITLVKCRNITIQGCTLQVLTLNSCQSVTVRENNLRKLEITYGGNNLIARNKIPRNALFQAKEHSWEKLSERLILIIIGMIVIVTFLLFNTPELLDITPWYIYFPIGIAILLFYVYLQMVFKRLRSRRLPPDRFEENIVTDERDMLTEYFKDRS